MQFGPSLSSSGGTLLENRKPVDSSLTTIDDGLTSSSSRRLRCLRQSSSARLARGPNWLVHSAKIGYRGCPKVVVTRR